ncbi:MAG: hypothetical protein KM296_08970 [Brockia lithotrophica]|nr:hypothetical protein [Brockia lithotrophica]
MRGKHRDCAEVGIESHPGGPAGDGDPQAEVEDAVRKLNDDPACTGYIVAAAAARRASTPTRCSS